ncbi:interferon-induced very large GTPase 1-like protein [Labeo rohita]|uniref:Interferon-induced very large GTPase 1-like protein n=1 Tax=Labeo rohita TaxID=84645 RepID=A0A498M054_LABRO|nr:interferon-induced very large GTPase 1-like protein [Labeo rohita]
MTDANPDALDILPGEDEENSTEDINLIQSNPLDLEDPTESKLNGFAQGPVLDNETCDPIKKEASEETLDMQKTSVLVTSQDQTPKTEKNKDHSPKTNMSGREHQDDEHKDKAKPVDEENNSKAVGNAEMIKTTVPSDSSCSDMGEPSINEETREHSMTKTRETCTGTAEELGTETKKSDQTEKEMITGSKILFDRLHQTPKTEKNKDHSPKTNMSGREHQDDEHKDKAKPVDEENNSKAVGNAEMIKATVPSDSSCSDMGEPSINEETREHSMTETRETCMGTAEELGTETKKSDQTEKAMITGSKILFDRLHQTPKTEKNKDHSPKTNMSGREHQDDEHKDKAKPVDEENNSKAVGNAEMIKTTVPSDSSCSDMGEPSINEETREHSMTETRETCMGTAEELGTETKKSDQTEKEMITGSKILFDRLHQTPKTEKNKDHSPKTNMSGREHQDDEHKDKAKPVDEENNSKAVGNAEMIKATVPSDSSCSDMGEPSISEETREHSMTETRETCTDSDLNRAIGMLQGGMTQREVADTVGTSQSVMVVELQKSLEQKQRNQIKQKKK